MCGMPAVSRVTVTAPPLLVPCERAFVAWLAAIAVPAGIAAAATVAAHAVRHRAARRPRLGLILNVLLRFARSRGRGSYGARRIAARRVVGPSTGKLGSERSPAGSPALPRGIEKPRRGGAFP